MSLKRKLNKLMKTAVVVGALMGAAVGESSADLIKADARKMGKEIAKMDSVTFEAFRKRMVGINGAYKLIKRALDIATIDVKNKLDKKEFTVKFGKQYVENLNDFLGSLYRISRKNYAIVAKDYGLKLESSFVACDKLSNEICEAIFGVVGESIKILKKQDSLSANDGEVVGKFIDILKRVNEKYYTGGRVRELTGYLNFLLYELDERTRKELEKDIKNWKKKDTLSWGDKKKIDGYLRVLKRMTEKPNKGYNKQRKIKGDIGTLYSLLNKVLGVEKNF